MQRTLIAFTSIAALAAACGKGNDRNAGPTGGGARDAVIDAWKKGGLEPSAFTPAQSSVGKDCTAGTVSKIDVMICQFDTPDAAKAAQDLGLQWVGDTTGISQAKGSLVIAAADRRKADPSGRTINQLFKLVPH